MRTKTIGKSPLTLRSVVLAIFALSLLTTVACSRDIRTVDDVVRATGRAFEKADYWQMHVIMRLNRPTHISEWEGVIYSDGTRYASLFNGGSTAGQLQSHLVIDGSGTGWLRITETDSTRVLTFDAKGMAEKGHGPEGFILPGNPATGNPLGMFLDPARALRILDGAYELQLTRHSQIEGVPVVGFSGSIKPGALSAIDPEGYLAAHNLPINEVDITVRLYDGAPRRIQFLDNDFGYFLIEYSEVVLDPERADARFTFNPGEHEPPRPVTAANLDTVAGVNEYHVLFEWDETRRVYPQTN